MNKRFKNFFLSLLIPGFGYLHNGDKKCFYKTVALFFSVIALGSMFHLFRSFSGLLLIIITLITIYFFTAVQATLKIKQATINQTSFLLRFSFTVAFILITGLSFANRRTLMGFDIMSMSVPVMQPTVLEGERFLVDAWAYKSKLPERGDIVAHSFAGQEGLYLNRIIAVQNDKVAIKNGSVVLNGKKLNEPYTLSANIMKQQSRDMKELTIPTGHYFVMGDNRDASFGDSRFSGTIGIDNIVGKTTDVIGSQDKSRIGKALR